MPRGEPLERDFLPVPMAVDPHLGLLVALAFGGWQLVVHVLDACPVARAVDVHVRAELADLVRAAR